MRESLDAVKEKAQSHIKTADEIVELANSLNQKFSAARAVSDKLKEAVVTSNNSVSEIAASTKLNADQIEQQTNRTADIQKSIKSVCDVISANEMIMGSLLGDISTISGNMEKVAKN